MCGLVGFVNRDMVAKSVKDFIKQSLIANSLRGIDGSGFCIVDEKETVQYYKRPLPGWDLVQLIPTNSILADTVPITFGLIHNRASTNGGNKIETSHPINFEHITLIHNGVVTQLHSLGSTWEVHDSTAIAIAMAQKSEKETLELLVGAYALIWYNAIDKTFNVARNDQRPLYMATVKKSKSLLFGSEDGMLMWLADRNDIDLKEISLIEPGTHFKISHNPNSKMKIIKFKPHTPPVYNTPAIGYSATNAYNVYTTIRDKEEFYGIYDGELAYGGASSKEYFKFKHIKDAMYGWVVDTKDHQEWKSQLVMGQIYRLMALESRVISGNCANLNAALMDVKPVDKNLINKCVPQLTVVSKLAGIFKERDEVLFETSNVIFRAKNGSMAFTGYTDDEDFIEVRGFNIQNIKLEKDTHYRARIKTIVEASNKMGPYILIDPTTIIEQVHNRIPGNSNDINCGWCDSVLTNREVINNQALGISNSGSLCDTCFRQYEKSCGVGLD